MFKPYFHEAAEEKRLPNGVDVIAVFNADGDLRPLYVKIEGHDSVKVERVLSSKTVGYAGMETVEFVCAYVFMNELRNLKLNYHVQEHVWAVPGMIDGIY